MEEWKVIFRTWNQDPNCGGNAHSGFVQVNTANHVFHSSACHFINFTLLWPRAFVYPIRERRTDSNTRGFKTNLLLYWGRWRVLVPPALSVCVLMDGLCRGRNVLHLRCDGWELGGHDCRSNMVGSKMIYNFVGYRTKYECNNEDLYPISISVYAINIYSRRNIPNMTALS